MDSVDATYLKNRLGEVLKRAALTPVAIERHGRVVAYLVPPPLPKAKGQHARQATRRGLTRAQEERLLELCARGDFRPSRWARAGDAQTLAGIAVMLASQIGFDRSRMLSLAERLFSGMSTPQAFDRWLAHAPVQAARFLPMLRSRVRGLKLLSRST